MNQKLTDLAIWLSDKGFDGPCQTIVDAKDYIAVLQQQLKIAEETKDWYRDRVVWGYYENELPEFYQGRDGENEICDPVTASQVKRYFTRGYNV
jgi:hypothetical protein